MRTLTGCLFVSLGLLIASPANAQNWSFDARAIALGGVGGGGNVAASMVDEQRPYRAIVLPFGLLQILPNLDSLDPSKDDFDLVRTVEYAASPLHYIIGRGTTDTGEAFITDIRNATLSLDLNTYRGFDLPTDVSAEGLSSPTWGGTIKFKKRDDGTFQGIYIGAGPYFSMQTNATIDPDLASFLSSATPVFAPNTSFDMTNGTVGQLAMSITGGYRARMAWPGGGEPGDGLYIGANYRYLKGFRHEGIDIAARLDTNNAGLLTINPGLGTPLILNRRESTKGSGYAIDLGVAAVVRNWEVGLGLNGIANRIDWTDVERTPFTLSSLLTGGEFDEQPTTSEPDIRVELPVDVRANAAYNAEAFTVTAEFADGFNGTSFRGGYEFRLPRVQLRGGARYIGERLEPTGGIGFNFTEGFGMDVALFGTSANFERKRQMAIAVSLRLMRKTEP